MNLDTNVLSTPRKVLKFMKDIDFLDSCFAIISLILWQVFQTKNPDPIYVPPDYSSVNFPLAKQSTITKQFLERIIYFVSLLFISLFYILSNKFPSKFPRFKLFPSIWFLIISNSLPLFINCYLKSYVGWPRPDMYQVCGYNSNYETCNSTKKDKEFLSWPSYHSTQAMSGATYLAFFIQKFGGQFLLFNILGIVMFFLAFLTSSTRIKEYYHHPDDVTAGLLIGFVIPFFVWLGAKKKIFIKSKIISTPNDQIPVTDNQLQ